MNRLRESGAQPLLGTYSKITNERRTEARGEDKVGKCAKEGAIEGKRECVFTHNMTDTVCSQRDERYSSSSSASLGLWHMQHRVVLQRVVKELQNGL